MNPEATVTSIDGVSAYDLISRESMLTELRNAVGNDRIPQGESKGTPSCPHCSRWGNIRLWKQRRGNSSRARVSSRIRHLHGDQSRQSWRELLEQWTPPQWCGTEQGLEILGTPLGHPDFVESHLQSACKQLVLLDRIPMVSDVQPAWLLLLHCISSGKFPVEGGATLSGGELCQDPQRRFVAVFVNIVAHRSSVRITNRARSGHVADVIGRSGVAQCLPNKGCSILGQLVRLLANDTRPTPSRCNRVGSTIGRIFHVSDSPRGCHVQEGVVRNRGRL